MCTSDIHLRFKIFMKLVNTKEPESISDCDMGVYIIHFDILGEDVNIRFGNLDNMHVADRLVILHDGK